ncbi:MAG: hypothetical protein IT324_25095 [Anaerolineae bacterium]|nr:hypothetical protein [Anaerolineae bacterium]
MHLSLNGSDWLFKGFIGEDWRWRDSHKSGLRDVRGWLTGTVPGSIHHDLWQHGEIPDPHFERNTLAAEWASDRTWVYKRTFTVGEEHRGKRIQLCFEGVDYEAQFFLNGELLGQHRGMYTLIRFEITDKLNYGSDNLLAVVIEPAPHEQSQVGRTRLVRTHKSRMTYWWDFCPRLVHLGIWDSVYLNITGSARIEDVWVRSVLSDDLSQAEIKIDIQTSPPAPVSASSVGEARFAVTIRQDDVVVAEITTANTSVNITINQPELWWPNRSGDQAVYEADIRLSDANGEDSDRRVIPFGIRRIEFTPNENADPTALPYTLVVNDRKIYINGWNWVPIDLMYGAERPDKLEHLLRLAQRANVNMLRIWGGGLIEKEAFYNLCDQLGILVWQEFIQSSSGIDNNPPDDPQMIELMVHEAEQTIPRKRNHPSLAIWCGGNELQFAPEQPCDDTAPMLAALHDVVRRLDPDRMWLPTSASGRVFMNSLDNIARDPSALHDVHGPWEYQGLTGQYTLYNRTTSLLHSEFGAEGLTNLKTLEKVISEQNRWPVTLDNPVWHHLGAWWVKEYQWRESLGEVRDLETLVRGTQYLQAEGLRYAIEANRRRQYQNSGSLPWQFNEPYPMAACTSAVDYYGRPKPLYYAVAHAYEPVHVSAKFESQVWAGKDTFEAEIWVSNATEESLPDSVLIAKLMGVSGEVYLQQDHVVNVKANGATKVGTFEASLDGVEDIFLLELLCVNGSDFGSINYYLFTRFPNLVLLSRMVAPATLQISVDRGHDEAEWKLRLTAKGNQFALLICVEDDRDPNASGFANIDNSHFCIAPGSSNFVTVRWHNVPPEERRLRIAGWNTPAVVITSP